MTNTIIDRDEPTIGVAEVARRFPSARGTGRVHPQTVVRWIRRGVKVAGGRSVKLEAVRVGHRWMTSEAAVKRFLTSATEFEAAAASLRSPGQRQKVGEGAAQEIEPFGA